MKRHEIIKAKVCIRRNIGLKVRPEAENIDGKIYTFVVAWMQGDSDKYPNEYALMPHDKTYPKDAPKWISEGDLKIIHP